MYFAALIAYSVVFVAVTFHPDPVSSSCSATTAQSCLSQDQLDAIRNLDVLMNQYNTTVVNQYCSGLNVINTCLQSKQCSSDDLLKIADSTKDPGFWKGAYDAIQYLCSATGQTGLTKYQKCVQNPSYTATYLKCTFAFQTDKVCRYYDGLLNCLNTAAAQFCSSSNFAVEFAKRYYQPSLSLYIPGCQLQLYTVSSTCNATIAASCLTQDQMTALHSFDALQKAYDIPTVKSFCTGLRAVTSCLQTKQCTADDLLDIPEPEKPYGFWKGVYDAYPYLCSDEGIAGLTQYQKCLSDPSYGAKFDACSFTFQNNKLCSYYNGLLSCLSNAAQTCSSSSFAVKFAQQYYQPSISSYISNCELKLINLVSSGCSATTAQSCLSSNQLDAIRNLDVLRNQYDTTVVNQYCSGLNAINTCLQSKQCSSDDLLKINDSTKDPGFWKGAYDAIQYLCSPTGQTGLQQYQKCVQNASYAAIYYAQCTFAFQNDKVCRYYDNLLNCLNTAAQFCSSSTFAVEYAKRFYQPSLSLYIPGCQLQLYTVSSTCTAVTSCLTPAQINDLHYFDALRNANDIPTVKSYCDGLRTVASCLQSKQCTADDFLDIPEPGKPYGFWKGVYDAYPYLCSDEGIAGLTQYQKCLSDPSYGAKFDACSFSFQNDKVCSYYNGLLSCLSNAAQSCSASSFAVQYAQKYYQPSISAYISNCELKLISTSPTGSRGNTVFSRWHFIDLFCVLLTSFFLAK